MKPVLQFCHSYGAPFLDVARQYAQSLTELGYHVITVYLKGNPNPEVEAGSASAQVIFLDNNSKEVKGLKHKAIRQLSAICAQHQFAFILAHRYKPIYIASKASSLPVIGVHHAFDDYQRWSRRRHLYRHRARIRLFAVSNAIRDNIRHHLPRIPPDHIQTLYNRIEPDALSCKQQPRQHSREHLQIPEQAYIFANVGRLHPDKDQSLLIRAFARVATAMPDTLLVIIGEGRLRSALEQEIAALGMDSRVRMTGSIPGADRYFKAFDCFVLSSDKEPFGMVLLEAMCAGINVISSDCGGAPEVVGDVGRLYTAGSVEALSEALLGTYRQRNNPPPVEAMRARIDNTFSDQAVTAAMQQALSNWLPIS